MGSADDPHCRDSSDEAIGCFVSCIVDADSCVGKTARLRTILGFYPLSHKCKARLASLGGQQVYEAYNAVKSKGVQRARMVRRSSSLRTGKLFKMGCRRR